MEVSGGQSSVVSAIERSEIDFDDDLFKELGFDLNVKVPLSATPCLFSDRA